MRSKIQLSSEPTVETRNRKQLEENELSNWELWVDKYRMFYDVVVEGSSDRGAIKAMGQKEHKTVYIE